MSQVEDINEIEFDDCDFSKSVENHDAMEIDDSVTSMINSDVTKNEIAGSVCEEKQSAAVFSTSNNKIDVPVQEDEQKLLNPEPPVNDVTSFNKPDESSEQPLTDISTPLESDHHTSNPDLEGADSQKSNAEKMNDALNSVLNKAESDDENLMFKFMESSDEED